MTLHIYVTAQQPVATAGRIRYQSCPLGEARADSRVDDAQVTALDGTASVSRPPAGPKVFGTLGLAILTFSFLANVNTTPELATFGLGSIVLFVLAIGLFLGPTAMASSEMGAGWPRTGGIYVWTRLAFGEAAGFVVIWLEWASFVIAWPSIMGTITLQALYAADPSLSANAAFLFFVVVVITWLAAGMAVRGMKLTKGFAFYSVAIGTVIPALMLIFFAAMYLRQGHAPAMEISASALIPDFNFQNIAFISGALLMFSGIEVAAIHAGDVNNPGRTMPRANLIAVAACFLLFAPLTLAISIVVPSGQINIVAGLVQSADVIFTTMGAAWLTPVFTFMVVTGLMAALVQIVNGPSRGLLVAGRQGGNLPRWLQKENGRNMPVAIIVAQAALSSVLAAGYLCLGSVQNAWFMFALVQTNMILIMYCFMFAAVIRLRFARPDVERPYRIPGRWVGLFVVTGAGLLVCVTGLLISLFPTEEATGMSTPVYVTLLVLITGVFVASPFIFWIFKKPSWVTDPTPSADLPTQSVG